MVKNPVNDQSDYVCHCGQKWDNHETDKCTPTDRCPIEKLPVYPHQLDDALDEHNEIVDKINEIVEYLNKLSISKVRE